MHACLSLIPLLLIHYSYVTHTGAFYKPHANRMGTQVREGDRIVQIDGARINSAGELGRLLRDKR